MENKIKEDIEKILSNFRISRDELKECLSSAYPKNSRMPEFITRVKNPFPLKSSEIKDTLWIKFGVPHQIFLNLNKYLEEEPKKEKAGEKPLDKAS